MTLTVQPRLLTLEGGEGAGKSTVLAAISAALRAHGDEVVCTREPGGTPLAEEIRGLLLATRDEPLHAQTELLLMFASRVQHVRETVQPALARGAWVVSDRFTDASHAYQGGGRGIDPTLIERLERDVVGVQAGLTLLLDVPVDVGLARARGRGAVDRIESERNDFFDRVRAAYRDRAAADPRRVRLLDATQPADVVAREAVAWVDAYRAGLR